MLDVAERLAVSYGVDQQEHVHVGVYVIRHVPVCLADTQHTHKNSAAVVCLHPAPLVQVAGVSYGVGQQEHVHVGVYVIRHVPVCLPDTHTHTQEQCGGGMSASGTAGPGGGVSYGVDQQEHVRVGVYVIRHVPVCLADTHTPKNSAAVVCLHPALRANYRVDQQKHVHVDRITAVSVVDVVVVIRLANSTRTDSL